jgi:hypothetical protein
MTDGAAEARAEAYDHYRAGTTAPAIIEAYPSAAPSRSTEPGPHRYGALKRASGYALCSSLRSGVTVWRWLFEDTSKP